MQEANSYEFLVMWPRDAAVETAEGRGGTGIGWKARSLKKREAWVCLFVCLFVCLLACLLVVHNILMD